MWSPGAAGSREPGQTLRIGVIRTVAPWLTRPSAPGSGQQHAAPLRGQQRAEQRIGHPAQRRQMVGPQRLPQRQGVQHRPPRPVGSAPPSRLPRPVDRLPERPGRRVPVRARAHLLQQRVSQRHHVLVAPPGGTSAWSRPGAGAPRDRRPTAGAVRGRTWGLSPDPRTTGPSVRAGGVSGRPARRPSACRIRSPRPAPARPRRQSAAQRSPAAGRSATRTPPSAASPWALTPPRHRTARRTGPQAAATPRGPRPALPARLDVREPPGLFPPAALIAPARGPARVHGQFGTRRPPPSRPRAAQHTQGPASPTYDRGGQHQRLTVHRDRNHVVRGGHLDPAHRREDDALRVRPARRGRRPGPRSPRARRSPRACRGPGAAADQRRADRARHRGCW
ncbi:hypothetical protein SBADM41S_03456 [Streptomyces badius]